MIDSQKPDSTICIDERLKETPVVVSEDQKEILRKETLRAWNLLRDYTHSLYRSPNHSRTGKEDYHG